MDSPTTLDIKTIPVATPEVPQPKQESFAMGDEISIRMQPNDRTLLGYTFNSFVMDPVTKSVKRNSNGDRLVSVFDEHHVSMEVAESDIKKIPVPNTVKLNLDNLEDAQTGEFPLNPDAAKNRAQYLKFESEFRLFEQRQYMLDGVAGIVRIKFKFDETIGDTVVEIATIADPRNPTKVPAKQTITWQEFQSRHPRTAEADEELTV